MTQTRLVEQSLITHAQKVEVEQFLFLEAELADSCQYDDWLALWAVGEIEYWVPCNDDHSDPQHSIAIILDDRQHLVERLARMKHRRAHTFVPAGRFQRVVGNIRTTLEGDDVIVTSTFVLGSLKRSLQEMWFGRTIHRLELDGDDWRMRTKKVMLLNNDEAMSNILFLP